MGTHYEGDEAEVRALEAYVKLSRAAAAVEARVNRHLGAAGLTMSQFGVLEALLHLGPLPSGVLARKLLTSPANLTTVLDNLARRDLIARRRDRADRRVTIVELADAGRRTIEGLFPRHVRRVVDAFAPLEPDEQETLARLCRTVGLAQGGRGEADDAAAPDPALDGEPDAAEDAPDAEPFPRRDR